MTRRLRLSLEAWNRLAVKLEAIQPRVNWRDRSVYRINAIGYSLLDRLQRASHSDALKAAVPPAPVFLLGFWRSGTTFLHELFCCDPRLGFPSTYACLNSSHFLLSEPIVRKRSSPSELRPMDNMKFSWATPQEDEFALLALGAPSPYEALLVPSLMHSPRLLLDLFSRPVEEQERWKEAIQYFIRLLTVQQNKRMVLKSPPHGFKLPLLPALFPGASYVVIERNPYEVFASNLKLWKTLIEMYGLEPISQDEIEEFVLMAYVLHEQAIVEGAPGLTLARLRYEDLVKDPVGQMARLYRELGMGDFDLVRPRLEQHVASVAGHQRNRFRLSQRQMARVDEAWGDLLRQKQYGLPDGYDGAE
jgi:hypothetical protein